MFLAERFQLLLDAEDDLGMIVVDSRFREDDARLRRFFADLTQRRHPVLAPRPDRRGPLPRPEPLLDRPPVRRPRCAITAAAERGGGQARGYLRTLMPRFASIRRPASSTASGSSASRSRCAGRGRRRGSSNRLPSSGTLISPAGPRLDLEPARRMLPRASRTRPRRGVAFG